jgi:outer membrane receptor for ferrienterochelin and colicin
MNFNKAITIILLNIVCAGFFQAQTDSIPVIKDSSDVYELSLEELLTLKAHGVPSELEELINTLISVSSKKAITAREAPGIVSFVTADDIRKTGARDLIDVLRMIPGIDFGTDVENAIAMGVRGNWAAEGKVLILLDGQEMNEIIWTSIFLGNHFAVDQIKRIEIIRGPGSAIYGGYAEYGVINIITFQGEDLNGFQISGTYGQMESDFGRRNLNISAGKKNKDFSFSIGALVGQGQRSDQTYTDFRDSSYSMKGQSFTNPNFLNVNVQYKGWSIRGMADIYNTTHGSGYGNVINNGAVYAKFHSYFGELKYNHKINNRLTLTPKINFKLNDPWRSPGYDDEAPLHIRGTRLTENLTLRYDPNRNISITLGGESFQDRAIYKTDSTFFANNKSSVNYLNFAGFAQALIKTKISNLIIGARFDKNNAYGQAFVPRIGSTKIFNRFHYKLLFGRSFRAPSIANINSADSSGIRPEYSDVVELEAGYKITKNSFFTINLFDITTTKPIVFYASIADSTGEISEYYTNFGSGGTQGLEAEYRLKTKKIDFFINYSYYTAKNKTRISYYQAGNGYSLLGFANHKINLSATYHFTSDLSLNTTATFYGKRWAVTGLDSTGNSIYSETENKTLINIFINYQTPVKGLSVGTGVYDALNQKFTFIQPYDGGHAPLPGPSREFILRIQYQMPVKNKTIEKK